MNNIIYSELITGTSSYTQTQQPAAAAAGSSNTVGLEIGLMLLAFIIMGGLWVFNKITKFDINSRPAYPFPIPNNPNFTSYGDYNNQSNWHPAYNGGNPDNYDDDDDEEEEYYNNGGPSNILMPMATVNGYSINNNQMLSPMPQPLQQSANLANQPALPVLTLRERTLLALQVLPPPTALPMPTKGEYEIPFMFDGTRWLSIRLGRDGDWGIFGAKGGGKGNLLQHIVIHSLWMGPEKVQLVVIDRKGGLDYSLCQDVAHARLYFNQEITKGLDYLIEEMERRNELFRKYHARNLGEYMRVTGQSLPLVVCVLDEIADYDKEQKKSVETLVRMARASGFVIFLATQYPTADVLSSQIQANVTNRVVFKLASSQNNWVALRRTSDGEGGLFDPSVIPLTRRGVGVCRLDVGDEYLGQVPEVTDIWRRNTFATMIARWPKDDNNDEADGTGLEPLEPIEPVPTVLAKKADFQPETGILEAGTSSESSTSSDSSDGSTKEIDPSEVIKVAGLEAKDKSEQAKFETIIVLLHEKGWNSSKIFEVVGGNKQERLRQIAQIKAVLDNLIEEQ